MEFIQSTEMMEALPCGVAFYELVGEKVLRRGVNTAFARTLGFDSAEAINACPAEEPLPFITHADLPLRQAMVARALAGENDYKQQLHMRCGDGRMGVMELCVHIVTRQGRQAAYVSISDQTDLQLRRRQLDVLVHTIPDGMAVFRKEDETAVCVYFNDTLAQMLGYSSEEFRRVVGKSARQLVHTEDQPKVHRLLYEMEGESRKIEREYRFYKKDRTLLRLHVCATSFRGESGELCCYATFSSTDEKQDKPVQRDYLAYLDRVLEQIPTGILAYQVDDDGVTPVNANERAMALLGYSSLKELQASTRFGKSKTFWDNTETKAHLYSAMNEQQPQRFLNHYERPDGGSCDFSVTFQKIAYFGEQQLLQVTLTDVTEMETLKMHQQALQDSMPGGVATFRVSEHFQKIEILHLSEKLAKLLGHDEGHRPDTDSSGYADIFPEDREIVRRTLEKTVESGEKTVTLDFRVTSVQKPFIWVNAVCTLLSSQDDSHIFYGLYTDVTQNHHHAKYVQGLIDTISGGVAIYRYDPERVQLEVEYNNEGLAQMLGYEPEEYSALVQKEQDMRVYETDRERVSEAFRKLLARLEPVELTYRVCGKTRLHWVRARYTPQRYDTGIVQIFAIFTDIDREMQQEETIGAILGNAPGGIAVSEYDIKTHALRVTYANAELKRLMGYPQDNLLERRWSENAFCDLPPKMIEEIRRKYRDCAFRRVRYENLHPMRRQDGKLIWMRVVVSFFPMEKNKMRSYGIYLDVTALVEAEQKLARMNERFRLLLEASHTITFDYDSRADTLEYSVFARDGRHLQQATRDYRATRPFDPQIHPEYRQRCLDAYDELLKKDGVRTLEIQTSYFTGGNGYGWNRVNMMSIAEADGSIRHVIGRIDDIQRERDQEKNFDQVLQQRTLRR